MKTTLSIVISTIIIGALMSSFWIQPAQADATIRIKADGTVDPVTAPIQRLGDTYTLTDNITFYNYGIIVERNNMTLDGAGHFIQGAPAGTGIQLIARKNVTVMKIEVRTYGKGIWLEDSSNITLRNTTITGCNYNLGVFGHDTSHFMHNIDNSNSVDGKPVYYWIQLENKTVPVDAGYVALIQCRRITMQNLNLTRNGQGTLLVLTTSSMLVNNSMTYNYYGIHSDRSWNNTIKENIIKSNNQFGMFLTHSPSNTICENQITSNMIYGLYFDDSGENRVFANIIAANQRGLLLWFSSDNWIFYNNFIGNVLPAEAYSASNTKWDHDYPAGGNYWSDYSGSDTNKDWIIDSPYNIDSSNRDNYPLIRQWTPHNIAATGLTCSKTVVGQGFNVTINATFVNRGICTENFIWRAYCNTTTLYEQAETLDGASSVSRRIVYNTTSLSKARYILWMSATGTAGETDLTDNSFTYGKFNVTSRGDVNENGRVNVLDLILVAIHLGHVGGDGHVLFSKLWYDCMNTDVNNDNNVNVLDLILVAKYLGT